jgi:hypothetical protein
MNNAKFLVFQRFALALTLLITCFACATVAPLSVRVTGAVRQTKVGVILPPRFNWPVSGVEVWAAINGSMNGVAKASKLALIDPREITIPEGVKPSIEEFWQKTNVAAVASRSRFQAAQVLLIEPVIERQKRKERINSGGRVIFAKAITFTVRLKLHINGQSAGLIQVRHRLSPMDLAVLDDELSVWTQMLVEATQQLSNELKSVPILQTEQPTYLREGIASMASTSLPGLTSPMAIPDTLRRLTEMDRLLRTAGLKVSGQEIEKALQAQPGVRVLRDEGVLKAGDLIVNAEEQPVRHPLTIARMLSVGVVHIEVLRGDKLIDLILEPR